MTPGQVISLVRDAAILAALAFVLWYVHRADQNAAKVADLQGVVSQLEASRQQMAHWAEESRNAQEQRGLDMQQVTAAIAAHREPVFVRNAPGACPVPGNPPAASGAPAGTGATDAGPERDIRPELNRFAYRYESALADCREALASWPK